MVTVSGIAFAQTPQAPQKRPASPPGTAQTQIGDHWIEITYNRPIKRGRDVFGSGAEYGKLLLANGATVWRAGANQSTRLNTEVPLVIGGKTVPAGEYSLFIELTSPTEWTLIVSSYGANKGGGDKTPDTLWGSFGYKPDKDVARAPMTVSKSQVSVDQLTWGFLDVTAEGGKLFLAWDTTNATVPFTVGK
ncbi:MAG: DUF2911 domain-containing protein [Vicinamibacterales bacterium]